jgi:phage-related protein (TIGR01555 family)
VDARVSYFPYARTRNQRAMRELWLGDGLAGRIVELPAEDMTRERAEFDLGAGFDDAKTRLAADVDELNVWAKFAQSLKYEAAYGGAGLIMALDDGMDWSQPVDVQRLRRVTALHDATPDELRAETYFNDKQSPEHRRPATYRWQPSITLGMEGGWTEGAGRIIHASRVIAFPGILVDAERLNENQGWGDSLLARCEERIRDMNSALAGAGVALNRFSQDVITSEGLGENLVDKKGKAALEARTSSLRMTQSLLGLLMLGKGETYDRKGISMSGVADTLHELAASLCATTGIPMAVLMGYAEAGLGDAAKSQRSIWHDRVRSQQGTRLRPALNRLLRLILLAKEGPTSGQEPRNWQVKFNPLDKPTDSETAALRKTYMEIDKGYFEIQSLRSEHVARNRFSGPDGFTLNLPPDPYLTEEVVPYQEPPEDSPGTVPSALELGGAEPPGAPPPPRETLGPQELEAAKGVVLDVVSGKLPRSSGVALLRAMGLPPEAAEAVMGDAGRATLPAPATARQDDVTAYAGLLLTELAHGTLSEEEVLNKVGRLYNVPPRQARALMKSLGKKRRQDAAGLTHFPRQGDNKRVGLKSSRFAVFDPAYAADLRENWPEVWGLSSNPLGAKQFERLLPVARAGGTADSDMELHAVRLREEWARRNAKKERPAGVVAQVKQLVVGRLGETGMKRVLEAAKEKVRRARQAAGAPPRA